jgi:hypothetical protein
LQFHFIFFNFLYLINFSFFYLLHFHFLIIFFFNIKYWEINIITHYFLLLLNLNFFIFYTLCLVYYAESWFLCFLLPIFRRQIQQIIDFLSSCWYLMIIFLKWIHNLLTPFAFIILWSKQISKEWKWWSTYYFLLFILLFRNLYLYLFLTRWRSWLLFTSTCK